MCECVCVCVCSINHTPLPYQMIESKVFEDINKLTSIESMSADPTTQTPTQDRPTKWYHRIFRRTVRQSSFHNNCLFKFLTHTCTYPHTHTPACYTHFATTHTPHRSIILHDGQTPLFLIHMPRYFIVS